jgi:Domain of unknown function (DUF5010)
MSRSVRLVIVATIVFASGSIPLDAEVRRNAGKYGAMFSWSYTKLPASNLYPPTIPWDSRNQQWWNDVVHQATQAGFGWLSADCWGQGLPGDPVQITPLLTAIDANGGTMKIALFDDTTSEVLRKNQARGYGQVLAPTFDLADGDGTGEGGWFYFYDQQWKRFFESVPDRYRFKINDRPVIFMWHGGLQWYDHLDQFHTMIDTLRQWTQRDFGFDPFVIPEESWLRLDPALTPDAIYDWFAPPIFATLQQYNGIRIGQVVPGYDCHLCPSPPDSPPIDRQDGRTYQAALDAVAPGSDLVLVEGLVNVDENAHLVVTAAWGSKYLDITRWYTKNIP